jgi:hypothetical protein
MPSKFDLLRQGQAVEIEPGLSGKLNKDKKTLELSSGEVLNVGHNKNFFPSNEQDLNLSKQREYAEKSAKGAGGEFFHQYASQGIPGSISDIGAYLTQSGDEYATRKRAQQDVSERISEESPYISGAATGANIATDFALTRGMSALKAAPLLTVGSSGSRILTDPGEVTQEAIMAAGGGYIADKVLGGVNRITQRRAQNRALPIQQENVRNSNIAGQEQFNMLKQNVKNVNEARLQQHQKDLQTRQNDMIKAQNNFEQAKAARDIEVVKLKNQAEIAKAQRSAEASRLEAEYKAAKASAEQETKRLQDEFKMAQAQYNESLKQMPELQKKAQAEFSENVVKNAREIERNFPKSSKLSTDDLGVNAFVDESINKTGLAGSREAAQARRVLNSIFPEGEILGGREIASRYKALEDAIQRATPEVQSVLNNFKQHLGQRLPSILEDSVAFSKIAPLLKRTLENDVKSIITELSLDPKMQNSVGRFANTNARTYLKHELNATNFVERIQSGELAREMADRIMGSPEHFLVDLNLTAKNKAFMAKQGTLPLLMQEAEKQYAYFNSELTKKIQNRLARYEIKAMESARNSSQKLGKDLKKTYGLAEPVAPPNPPASPSSVALPAPPGELPPVAPINIPPPVQPPLTPPIPGKPSLMPEPSPFVPQAEPVLPAASGLSERIGDFMEKPNLGGGSGVLNNPVTKLAGLKYLLGKAALPAEAAYLGMNALTSPTAAGEVARLTFKQGGIRAIENWAQKYPSYHDGILESPQDRRSLTKEIEDASDIPIEQKAVIQSKINRGKPLQDRL